MTLILSGTNGVSDVDGTAATPAVRGSDTNTGIYFPGADRIGFAEGGVQVGEFDASGNFLMNSGYGSPAIAYGCRAWVNFNGTGTVAIRASGNVSSITDNGLGTYRVNLTTAMLDANFCPVFSYGWDPLNNNAMAGIATIVSSSAVDIILANNLSGGTNDSAFVNVAIFR